MTYCYACDNGHHWEITVDSLNDRPVLSRCPECDLAGWRDYRTEKAEPPPPSCYSDQGMLWSDAAGVCSARIAEERQRHPKHIFRRTEEGTYQRGFRNARHRRQCLKELGLVDKRSYC
jgi:hypothetical protein